MRAPFVGLLFFFLVGQLAAREQARGLAQFFAVAPTFAA